MSDTEAHDRERERDHDERSGARPVEHEALDRTLRRLFNEWSDIEDKRLLDECGSLTQEEAYAYQEGLLRAAQVLSEETGVTGYITNDASGAPTCEECGRELIEVLGGVVCPECG